MNENPKPGKPIVTLVMLIVISICAALWMYFIKGDSASKVGAFVIPPIVTAYGFYAYFKEKRQDRQADVRKEDVLSGTYFRTQEWYSEYTEYRMKHPFEHPMESSMEKDLLRRHRRRGTMVSMMFFGFFACSSAVALICEFRPIFILGVIIFSIFFIMFLNDFTGRVVRKWLKGNMDYPTLEYSYLHGRMLTYKSNGVNLGTTHIHGYTEKEIYAIDYEHVEDLTRKIVRVKSYENSIYSGDDYKYFVVIHTRLPESGDMAKVEIELNEYQVQMVIDEFQKIKYKPVPDKMDVYAEDYDDNVTL